MNEAEIKAQADAARIVKVTNPFDFDFTHAWGGVPYTLPAGKPMLFPYPLADHLATHLARHSLIRKAPVRDEAEIDGKGKDRPLWSEEAIAEIKNKIMVEQYTEERQAPVSEAEMLRRKIEELNRNFAELSARVDATTEAPQTVTKTDDQNAQNDNLVEYTDKAQVIAELTKRGVKFNVRSSKADLEKLLAE